MKTILIHCQIQMEAPDETRLYTAEDYVKTIIERVNENLKADFENSKPQIIPSTVKIIKLGRLKS